jgi:hypothetical protein
VYLFLCTGPGLAPGFLLLFDNSSGKRGRKLNVKLSVSKAELGGSNPSARAKLASEAEVDIAQVS